MPKTLNARGQASEEPPGAGTMLVVPEQEEPPGIRAGRNRFFGNVPESDWNDWRWQFRNRITETDDLAKRISLSAVEEERLKLVTSKYPLAVTPYYLSLVNPDDTNDPIRKQCVPCFEEIALAGMGLEDPLEEESHSVVPGLVHRYPDRVLVVLTNMCPMLCRHCTRKREWRHGWWMRTPPEIDLIMAYIGSHDQIRDVVISGGDPLSLSTRHLEGVISRLRAIKHIEIIRIGTRFPAVLPQRIDDELCSMLSRYGPIWLNTQFNHVREVTEESAKACERLLRSGVPVNNQSVLLRGVNDTLDAQMKLVHGLLKARVRPYYLYECDEVQGTEHFRTPVETGLAIMEGLRGHTSGLAVPTFVIDLPHNGGKVPVQPSYLLARSNGNLILRNYEGRLFRYRNPTVPARNGRKSRKNGAHSPVNGGSGVSGLPVGA